MITIRFTTAYANKQRLLTLLDSLPLRQLIAGGMQRYAESLALDYVIAFRVIQRPMDRERIIALSQQEAERAVREAAARET